MAVSGGYLRIGAGNANGGNARVGKILGTGDGNAGAIGAQHHADARADQLLGGGGSLVGGGAVIGVDQFYLIGFASDINGGLHAVGVLHTQNFLLAASTAVAGGRLKHADFHNVFGRRKGGNHHQNRQEKCKIFFHPVSPPDFVFCFCETMQIICASFLKCNMPSMKMHEKNKSNPKSCAIWYAILKNCKF